MSANAHLEDDEIDRYVAHRLPEERQLAIEQHFVDCPDCLARVQNVEHLAEGLRDYPRASRRNEILTGAVAAALAVVSLGLGLRLRQATAELERVESRADDLQRRLSLPVAAPSSAPALAALADLRLEPGVRGADATLLKLEPGILYVLVHFDAREAGVPGSTFDVSLSREDGRRVVSLAGLKSSSDGVVSFVLPASSIGTGLNTVSARASGEELRVPFVCQR